MTKIELEDLTFIPVKWVPPARVGLVKPGYCSIVVQKHASYIAMPVCEHWKIGEFIDFFYDREHCVIGLKANGATRKIKKMTDRTAQVHATQFLRMLKTKRDIYPVKWHEDSGMWIIKYHEGD